MDVMGIVFDGDDVLYDATVWRRWLLQLLARFGLHTHYRSFYRLWEREHSPEVNEGRCDYWCALRTYLRSVGLTPGQIEEVVAASRARYRRLHQNLRPLPGVLATVASLSSAGVPMAVLNNVPWTAERTERVFAKMGLANRFSIRTSFDLGCAKPNAKCYHAAVASLGPLQSHQVAFVGHDSIELEGAAKVGMPTIAVNHNADATADVYLESIECLTSAIRFRSPRLLAG